MKSKFLCPVVFFATAALTAAHAIDAKPVDLTQIVAWSAAGISTGRLVRLAGERGLKRTAGKEQLRQLQAAGADPTLIHALAKVKAEATDIPAALLEAVSSAHARQFHKAELVLRQAVSSDPQNAALHFALGAMLIQQEQWEAAFDEVTESARLMPDLPENHNAFAYIFYRLDDGPNSIAEARTALSMDPQNAEAYHFLGLGHYSTGQYASAVHAYNQSIALDPDNPETYFDLGVALHAQGSYTAALTAYNKAIDLRPSFWEAHANLATTLHEQGRLSEAVAEFQQARHIAPHEASVRSNLGATYCDQGNFDAAIAELRDLYREHPEWQQGHGCLASAYMAKKDYDSAVAELQVALRQNPNGSTEHRVLGQAFMLDNKPEEALREFRLAVMLNPDSDVAHHYLGTALFEQQQLSAAEKEFREALRLKASADNHYSLAACLMSMDRYQEALGEIESAARLDPERPLYRARREELLKLIKSNPTR